MAPVLVVDDDPQVRQFIREVLEDEGLAVETAADGRQALDLIAQRPPALVVLDITLPVLGGVDLADRLRAALGNGLPILVITADGNATQKAEQVRAYAHLRKPFAMDDLLAAVRRGLPVDRLGLPAESEEASQLGVLITHRIVARELVATAALHHMLDRPRV